MMMVKLDKDKTKAGFMGSLLKNPFAYMSYREVYFIYVSSMKIRFNICSIPLGAKPKEGV